MRKKTDSIPCPCGDACRCSHPATNRAAAALPPSSRAPKSFRPNLLERLPQPTRRQLLLGATALGAGSLLTACGAGGSNTTPSSAIGGDPPASFDEGPITGFGSIIVGGLWVYHSAAVATVASNCAGLSSR
jgi:hypothetical protein